MKVGLGPYAAGIVSYSGGDHILLSVAQYIHLYSPKLTGRETILI